MGSGKSSAAITYINEHPHSRFIYLAPYLDEGKRIKAACPKAHFVEPKAYVSTDTRSKCAHTLDLLRQGRNIVSTHEALMRYTGEMMELIRDQEYIVIIDEAVNILSKVSDLGVGNRDTLTDTDIQILVKSGFIYEAQPGEYARTDQEYGPCLYSPTLRLMDSRSLIRLSDKDPDWCWLFSPQIFLMAKEVFVLTYLFEGSEMEQFLKIHGLSYEFIGVSVDEHGVHRFSIGQNYVPEYVSHIHDMIHICDAEKLNAIGDGKYALSDNWFKQEENEAAIKQLKNHEENFFRHFAHSTSDKRMVGCFKGSWERVKGKGFGKKDVNMVMFNQRAENKWMSYNALSYPVNLFINPYVLKFYNQRGGKLDQDAYALSTMVQWIWRSAIRCGEEIYLYLPSRRMRGLLLDWMDKISKEGIAVDVPA